MSETLNNLEFELLLSAIKRRYGVDLAGYARGSLMRRVEHFIGKFGLCHSSELLPRILQDRDFFCRFINDISVSVTEFYRDPSTFFTIATRVLPNLSHLPYLKIWHAGCASGQEAYSLAVLLYETGLLDKSTIYATDINHAALDRARQGIYEKAELLRALQNYKIAGGSSDLYDYCTEKYEYVRFHAFLRTRIAFAHHDLVSHTHFSEINLLLCRNVFIYFDRELQKILTEKFANSLVDDGFLVLGNSESMQFIDTRQQFDCQWAEHRIYKRKPRASRMEAFK